MDQWDWLVIAWVLCFAVFCLLVPRRTHAPAKPTPTPRTTVGRGPKVKGPIPFRSDAGSRGDAA
jgi:hypothetical protein